MLITYENDNGIQATYNITKMQATFLSETYKSLYRTLLNTDLSKATKETSELAMRYYIVSEILVFFYVRMSSKLFDNVQPFIQDDTVDKAVRKYIADNASDKYIDVCLWTKDFLIESAGRTIHSHYVSLCSALNTINLRMENLLTFERFDYDMNGENLQISMNTIAKYSATETADEEFHDTTVERLTLSVATNAINRYNVLLQELARKLKIDEIKLLQFYYPKHISEQVEFYNHARSEIERLVLMNDSNPLMQESKIVSLKSLFKPFDYTKSIPTDDIRPAVNDMFKSVKNRKFFYDIIYKNTGETLVAKWDTFIRKDFEKKGDV